MADVTLLIQGPDRAWAEGVRDVVQRELGDHGSIRLGHEGESMTGAKAGYVITALATCHMADSELLDAIGFALAADYAIDPREPESGHAIHVYPLDLQTQ